MKNAAPIPFSKSRVLWQVILLYITTCGLYFFYWFYKTCDELYAKDPRAIKPLWRTLGLLVPLLNIYLVWKLFFDIQNLTQNAGVHSFGDPLSLTVFFLLCSALYQLPNLYSFCGFLSVLPVALIQKKLNLYWKKQQPYLPERTTLRGGEITVCLIGGLILILAFIGVGLSPAHT